MEFLPTPVVFAPAPPEAMVGRSLFCFEEAGPCPALSSRQNGRRARGRAVSILWSSRLCACRTAASSTFRVLDAAFENCIASTSVLKEVFLLALLLPRKRRGVCEFSSYKEPTVDALAPDADEGRGWLRKATGSCLPSFDPWITEWGNPAGVMPSHSSLNT
jgi:hypothetical protein